MTSSHKPASMRTGPKAPPPIGGRVPDATEDLAKTNEMSIAVDQMRAAHRAVREAEGSAVKSAQACGRLLTDLKAKVGEREWPDFVQDHSGMTSRQASFYIKLAKFADDPAFEGRRLADLEIMLAARAA